TLRRAPSARAAVRRPRQRPPQAPAPVRRDPTPWKWLPPENRAAPRSLSTREGRCPATTSSRRRVFPEQDREPESSPSATHTCSRAAPHHRKIPFAAETERRERAHADPDPQTAMR